MQTIPVAPHNQYERDYFRGIVTAATDDVMAQRRGKGLPVITNLDIERGLLVLLWPAGQG